MYRQISVLFGSRCFNALNVQFHSNSFTQRSSSITLWRNDVYHSLSKNYFPLIFIGFAESRKTSESEPSTFRILKSHRQPCGHHSRLKYGHWLAGFASCTFGAARKEIVGDHSVPGIITQYQGLSLSTRDYHSVPGIITQYYALINRARGPYEEILVLTFKAYGPNPARCMRLECQNK